MSLSCCIDELELHWVLAERYTASDLELEFSLQGHNARVLRVESAALCLDDLSATFGAFSSVLQLCHTRSPI